ncbi:MAG: efflux RND transporter permease subunit [Gemmatimonadales bacterium]
MSQRSSLSGFAIKRPIGTLALASVVVVLGWFYVGQLAIDLLPQIVYPQVRVGVRYPGVAPEVLEEQVTKVLETRLATTENLIRLESETQEGRVDVSLYFRYGTDMNFALQDASKNLDRARAGLPDDVEPPSIFKFDPSQVPVYEVGLSSPTMTQVDLRRWVDIQLVPPLLPVEGVGAIDVAGGLQREVQVVLDQERLRSYRLTVADVLAALRNENQDIAAGNLTSADFEIVGKTAGKFRTVGDIRSVLLSVPGTGQRVPLSDLAMVADTNREQRLWARLNDVPAVKLSVRKLPESNTVDVASGVGSRLEQLRESRFIPDDITFRVVADQSFFVKSALSSVNGAAALGAALAMVVVLLFLGSLRKTFIIGLSIPIAVLATLALMGMSGLTLNIMTLGGLALGVGLLLDNSIVMLENIFRHRGQGKDATRAATEGASEVTSAVVASTTTNLAAVVPFLLISGLAALIFRELILTITFSMVASLGVALTLVPMLTAQFAKVRFASRLDRSWPILAFNRGVGRVTNGYRRVARRTLAHRWWTVLGAVGALALILSLARNLPNEFLPVVDDGAVSVNVNLPPGTPPERTNEVVKRLEQLISGREYVRDVFATAGGFLFGGSTSERGGRGSINIQLVPGSERPGVDASVWVAELQAEIDALGIPGARISARPPRIRGLRTNTSGSDIAVAVQGDDLAMLQRVAGDVLTRMGGIAGLEGLQVSTEEASPQLSIRIDRERVADLGLNVSTVGQTVRTALEGSIATRFAEGNYEYDVRVRLPRSQFQSAEDLGAIALFPGRDQPIYLRDVATITVGTGPTTILRENQNRMIRVTGDVNTAVASVSVVSDQIRARLSELPIPEGFGLIYGGEEEAIRENNRNLAIVIGLAIFLVFVVLTVQYESVVDPLVILVSVPLALIGVGAALLITGTPMSAPVLLGVILLAGIVVNNAILLVEYVEIGRREEGLTTEEAIVEAGAVRLRPILMTTLTTVLGMLPLSFGIGEGTELMRPLAVAVVGGLMVSTFLTLILIPAVYLIATRAAARLAHAVTGAPIDAEHRQAAAGSPVTDS